MLQIQNRIATKTHLKNLPSNTKLPANKKIFNYNKKIVIFIGIQQRSKKFYEVDNN